MDWFNETRVVSSACWVWRRLYSLLGASTFFGAPVPATLPENSPRHTAGERCNRQRQMARIRWRRYEAVSRCIQGVGGGLHLASQCLDRDPETASVRCQ